MESKEYEKLIQNVRYMDIGSKFLLVIIFFLFFFYVINPFVIEDVINQEWGYAAGISDIYFIKRFFGYYDYTIFIFLAFLNMFIGLTIGATITMFLRKIVKVKKNNSTMNSILKWDKEILVPFSLAGGSIGIIHVFFDIFRSKSIMFPEGLYTYLIVGVITGITTYTYYAIRKILKLSKTML